MLLCKFLRPTEFCKAIYKLATFNGGPNCKPSLIVAIKISSN